MTITKKHNTWGRLLKKRQEEYRTKTGNIRKVEDLLRSVKFSPHRASWNWHKKARKSKRCKSNKMIDKDAKILRLIT